MMMKVASFPWFARHELSLSWRDLYAMLSGNKPGRIGRIAIILALILTGLHLLAYAVLKPYIATTDGGLNIDQQMLIMVSGFLLLPASLMASQAMESITRAFYTRSDLELILSSPAPTSKLFMIRMSAIAFATTVLTLCVCAPALNVLAFMDQPGWLFGYAVIICSGLLATSFSILLTMAMFKIIGTKKTRLMAQILAAIVGAVFVVGIQIFAIASIGSISRIDLFSSQYFSEIMPSIESLLWLPAKAATGDLNSVIVYAFGTIVTFGACLLAFAPKFGVAVLKASSADFSETKNNTKEIKFNSRSAASVLRQKERKLLLRDKWLFSQTLMQLFYLLPPAYMLWQGFGQNQSSAFIAVPVLVMAAGQLAGGLAWLAISGEDAPELVATAPISNRLMIRAKIEAVLSAVGIVTLPIIAMLAFLSPRAAVIGIICIVASSACATAIQLWFKTQAKRSNFRRRQTSSRIATFGEAFSSIFWAGTAGLWIAGSWYALLLVCLNLAILFFVWRISPSHHN